MSVIVSRDIMLRNKAVEPRRLGMLDKHQFHETKASIMDRLMDGKSREISKLQIMQKSGMAGSSLMGGGFADTSLGRTSTHQQNRALKDIEAMREHRLIIPFRGGLDSPFLNFSSGRSTKTENRQRPKDPIQGRKMIKIDTSFNRL